MNTPLKILYVLSWILPGLIKFLLWVIGLVVIPIAFLFDVQSTKWPKVFWLWANQENVPAWWLKDAATDANVNWFVKKFPKYWWYAFRNIASNTQFIFKDRQAHIDTNWLADTPVMEAPQMIIAGQTMASAWRWSGPFAGYRRVWLCEPSISYESETECSFHYATYSEIWFGWKVGSAVPGMGFTFQWRRNRKVGT